MLLILCVIDKEGPKFKVSDNVRISKYQYTFAKDYVPNRSKKYFVIKKVGNTVILFRVDTCY